MSETTQVRGLNRELLSRAKDKYPSSTHGRILNDALQLLLGEPAATGPTLDIVPPIEPQRDLNQLPVPPLPGVSLEQAILDAR